MGTETMPQWLGNLKALLNLDVSDDMFMLITIVAGVILLLAVFSFFRNSGQAGIMVGLVIGFLLLLSTDQQEIVYFVNNVASGRGWLLFAAIPLVTIPIMGVVFKDAPKWIAAPSVFSVALLAALISGHFIWISGGWPVVVIAGLLTLVLGLGFLLTRFTFEGVSVPTSDGRRAVALRITGRGADAPASVLPEVAGSLAVVVQEMARLRDKRDFIRALSDNPELAVLLTSGVYKVDGLPRRQKRLLDRAIDEINVVNGQVVKKR